MSDPLGSALTTRKVILILNIENAVLLSFSGIIIWRKIGKERRRRLCHLASFSLTVLPLFFLVCWLSCRVCLICWRLSSYLLQTGLSSSLLSHAKRKENSWWTQKQLFRIFNLYYFLFCFVFSLLKIFVSCFFTQNCIRANPIHQSNFNQMFQELRLLSSVIFWHYWQLLSCSEKLKETNVSSLWLKGHQLWTK